MKLLQFQPSSCAGFHQQPRVTREDAGTATAPRAWNMAHDSLSPFIGAFWATVFSSPVWALAIWGFCHFRGGR